MSATLPPKLYFRIGEVSGLVGVEPHVLRYWEREFARTIRPTKSAKGQRVYSRRDVENLMKVRELLYTEGFTIAGARKQLQTSARSTVPGAEDAAGGIAANDAGAGTNSALAESARSADSAALSLVQSGERNGHCEGDGALPSGDRAHVSAQLRDLRDELSAFLAELGG